jgi:hypothetical protein
MIGAAGGLVAAKSQQSTAEGSSWRRRPCSLQRSRWPARSRAGRLRRRAGRRPRPGGHQKTGLIDLSNNEPGKWATSPSHSRCPKPERQVSEWCSPRLCRRRQWLSLLDNVGNKQSGRCIAGLAPRMRCFRRYLEAVAGLNCPGWLTLYGKFEATFQNVSRFDPRMSVSPDCHAGLDCRLD